MVSLSAWCVCACACGWWVAGAGSGVQVANEAMGRMAEALVRGVEGRKKARVVAMTAEFLADGRGRVWLLRTTECLTSVDGPAVRGRDPGQLRGARVGGSAAVGQALTVAPGNAAPPSEENHYGVEVGAPSPPG